MIPIFLFWLSLAAIVYTYPLVIHFGEAIPYGLGVSPERRVQGLVPGDQRCFDECRTEEARATENEQFFRSTGSRNQLGR